ncbi:MAG: acyltransferase [bacterium]
MLHRIIQRLLGQKEVEPRTALRTLCVCDPSAVFHDTAKIVLNGRAPESIRVGRHTHIRGDLVLFGHGGRIDLGDWCYVGENSRLWSAARITVGNRVLIAHNVTIMDSLTHPLSAVERHRHFRDIVTTGHPKNLHLGEKPVTLEDDAWIGCHCVVLRGVTVGARGVVAAGSVVTQDVPPGVIVAGNPAKVIREIDDD